LNKLNITAFRDWRLKELYHHETGSIRCGMLGAIPVVALILIVALGASFWKGAIKPVALGGPRAIAEADEHFRDRGFIGIQYDSLPDDELDSSGIESRLIVTHVLKGSPAESSGIVVGDCLVEVDGIRLSSREHMQSLSATWKPAQRVRLTVARGDADESNSRVVECRLITFDRIAGLQRRHRNFQSN
jgi:S1-C subfamily serine protease